VIAHEIAREVQERSYILTMRGIAVRMLPDFARQHLLVDPSISEGQLISNW